MPIGIGSPVPQDCSGDNKLQKGLLFTFLKVGCSNPRVLEHLDDLPTSFKGKLPRKGARSQYVSQFSDENLRICDTTPTPTLFAHDDGYLLRARVAIKTACPFNGHEGVNYQANVQYGESISPSNFRNSPILSEMEVLSGPSNSDTYVTDSIGDPYGFGSTGIASCTLRLSLEYNDPSNLCEIPGIRLDATLNSLGRGYNFLSGTPVNQIRRMSCENFVNGIGGMAGFWTGLSFAMGPIGLVMNLFYEVRGGFGYSG